MGVQLGDVYYEGGYGQSRAPDTATDVITRDSTTSGSSTSSGGSSGGSSYDRQAAEDAARREAERVVEQERIIAEQIRIADAQVEAAERQAQIESQRIQPTTDIPQQVYGPVRQEQPTKDIFQPKTDLQIVQETFNRPDITEIKYPSPKISTKEAEKLLDSGKIVLSSGLVVVTPEYAAKENIEGKSTKAFWIVEGENIEDVREEIGFAEKNIDVTTSNWRTAGTFERDMSLVDFRRKEYFLGKESKEELEKEIQIFQEDPKGYAGATGQSTKEGELFTISEDYLSKLPATGKLITFAETAPEEYKESQQYARDLRLGTSIKDEGDYDFWKRQDYSVRNLKLTTSGMGSSLAKIGLGAVDFGWKYTVGGLGGELTEEKMSKGGLSFLPGDEASLFQPGSKGRMILDMPTTQTLSGFRYIDPSTWTKEKAGTYATEWISRPEAVGTFTATGALVTYGLGQLGSAYKLERLAGASKSAAAGTVFGETISSFGLAKIQPGTYTAGVLKKEDVAAYNKDLKGFTKIDIQGTTTKGLTGDFKMITPKDRVIPGKSTLPDEEFFGITGMPIQTTKPVVSGKEDLFGYSSIRYSGTGLNFNLRAIPIPTVQVISPIVGVTVSSAQDQMRTSFQRQITTSTTQPRQTTRYDFVADKTVSLKVEDVNVITKIINLNGDLVTTGSQVWTRPIGGKYTKTFGDTGISETTGLIKFGKGEGLTTVTTEGISLTPTKNLVTKDVKSFEMFGRTMVDDLGKPVEGVVIDYTSSTLAASPPGGKISGIGGKTEFFIPEKYLTGGGGGGVSPSTGVGPSLGTGQSAFPGTDFGRGLFRSFDQPRISYIVEQPSTFGPLSLTTPTTSAVLTPSISSVVSSITAQTSLITPSTVTKSVPLTRSLVVPTTAVSTATSTTTATATATATATITPTISTLIQVPTPITNMIIPPKGGGGTTIKTPYFPIIPLKFPPFKGKPRPMKKTPNRYNVQALDKGKWHTLNKKPLTRSAAKSLGARATDNTTSKRFRIQPSRKKGIVKSGGMYWATNQSKFRPYKVRKGQKVPLRETYIEKTSFGLDTRGEKKGLSVAKWKSQQSKTLFSNNVFAPTKKLQKKYKGGRLF